MKRWTNEQMNEWKNKWMKIKHINELRNEEIKERTNKRMNN